MSTVNPLWSHMIWDEQALRSIGIHAQMLYSRLGNWASVSNYARLVILKKLGGYYFDTDFEAIKPMEMLNLGEGAHAAEQDGGRICNAFMAAPPNDPWITWQLRNFRAFDQKDAAGGVYLATAAPRDLVTIIPQAMVYPWMYDSQPEHKTIKHETVAVHHWAGSWCQKEGAS